MGGNWRDRCERFCREVTWDLSDPVADGIIPLLLYYWLDYVLLFLNHFSISDISLPSEAVAINKKHDNLSYSKRSTRAISLPVDLKSFPQVTGTENMLYLHVFVAKNAQWNKPIIRYSDRLELKSIDKTMLFSQYTEDCTVYTCP